MPVIEKEVKQKLFENYYKNLNDKQREAVLTYGGPLLVIAGAGSGKTTVLVNRIAHLIHYGNAYDSDRSVEVNDQEYFMLKHISKEAYSIPRDAYPPILKSFADSPCPPDRILAITFTNKAAGEIKERLVNAVGEQAKEIWAGTFHSICVRLLRRFADLTEYGRDFTIYDQDDCKKLISSILKDMEIDNEELTPKYLANVISKAKNALQTPEDFEKINQLSEKRRICSEVYTRYQKELIRADAMDFDDLIGQTVKLLKEKDEARLWCQNKFRFVLVDEYQDTNHAQYLFMRLIADGARNIMVVGDDDQSIYKFRGAAVENILNFDKQYPDAKVVLLEQNYRSTRNIIAAANALIENNRSRRGKTLWSDNLPGLKTLVKQLEDQEKEALYLVDDINRLILAKNFKYNDIAILYRTKAQANVLETVFTKAGLPHRLLSGLRFTDHAEVKDLIAYLRFIHNKSDFISFNRIINVPRRGIGQTTVEKIRTISQETAIPFYDILAHCEEFEPLKRSAAKLKEFYRLIETLTLYSQEHTPSEIVHKVIDASGYMETLLGDENEERRKNVEEFISTAIFFEEKHEEPTFSEFLEELALVSDVDNYDENSNSVVMMTVHAAKGLEFPIVYLVGMEENIFPSPQSAGTEDDLEEERRLAYVAMTRAQQELYITCAQHRMLYGKTTYNEISRFVREIPEDLLTFDLYKPNYRRPTIEEAYGYKTATIYRVTDFDAPKSTRPTYQSPARKSADTPKAKIFSPGDRVSHGVFGLGTILSAKSYASDTLYEIKFDTAGTKKLMATYAKLKEAK